MDKSAKKNENFPPPLNIPGPHPLIYHLCALLLPLYILNIISFLIFKQLLKLYLILKHGRYFGGFFNSADAVWWVQDTNYSSIVPLLLIVESKKKCDMVEKVRSRLKSRIFDTNDYPKLKSTCNFSCGYPYMVLDQYNLEECVKIFKNPDINKPFDEKYMCEVISGIGSADFEKKDAMWEVFVTNRYFDSNQNEFSYPILIKFNHAVADGVAMVTFLVKLLGDATTSQYIEKIIEKYMKNNQKNKEKSNFTTHMVNLKNLIIYAANLLHIILGRLFWTMFIREKDQSALHGPILTGEKIAVLSWEHKEELVPLVKKIKNRVPNCTFSDVLYTALSASLTDFYKTNGYEVPKKLTSIIPIVLSYREVSKPGPVNLLNKYSITVLDMPLQEGTICHTLERVKQQNVLMKRLPEVEMNYWLLNYIVGAFPIPILKQTLNLSGLTQIISNVPGADRATILDDCELVNVACFPPHRWKTGVSIMFITFDNKLQVGLIVDTALISSRDQVQKIVDDILKNIKKIDKETSLQYGN